MFRSSIENKLVTLSEYIERMKEGQEHIYYASGDSVARIDSLPQVEAVKDRGYEIFYLTEDVDEFCVKVLQSYEGKEIKHVSEADLNTGDGEKQISEEVETESIPLLEAIKEALGSKVKEVKLTSRLKSHPVCISNDGGISIEMEKVLSAMPDADGLKTQKILEINPEHKMYETMKKYQKNDPEKLVSLAHILYTQALLVEGVSVEDPASYVKHVYSLLD